MRRVLLSLLLAACAPGASDETPDDAGNAHCDSARNIAALPAKLHEASGVAASTRHTGILWVHNDSGEPIIFAIDTLGNERARVRISLPNTDWEDIAVAPCPEGSCIYLGAIGDNLQRRQDRAVLRFPEPDLKATTPIKPVKLRYRLPNGAHDTEALFVLPDARIFLVTKGRSGKGSSNNTCNFKLFLTQASAVNSDTEAPVFCEEVKSIFSFTSTGRH